MTYVDVIQGTDDEDAGQILLLIADLTAANDVETLVGERGCQRDLHPRIDLEPDVTVAIEINEGFEQLLVVIVEDSR